MADSPEINDQGLKLTVELAEHLDEIFDRIKKSSQAFEAVLQDVALSSDDIPDSLSRGDRLMQAMIQDAKLFEKVEKRTLENMNAELEEALSIEKKKHAANLEGFLLKEEELEIERQFGLEAEKINKILRGDFDALRDSAEAIEKQEKSFGDIKKTLDDMASKIRNPAKAAEGMLSSLGELPEKLRQAKKDTGSWGGAIKDVAGDSKLGKIVKTLGKGGPIVIGIIAATAVLVILFKLYKNFYEFMDKNIIPAHADFNKQLGNTNVESKKLESQAAGMGVRFEYLGLQFSDGAKMVRDFAEGMMSVKPMDRETMKSAENLVGVLGVGGEAAGKFALMIKKQTGNLKALKEMMVIGGEEASRFGVPIATVQKDMANSPEVFARFGVANRKTFAEATAKARTYGLSIKEIDSAFGDQMATFEGSAEAGAKLNAIFGTQINSMELMMKQNPQERFELLRKELVNSGVEWENIGEKQKMMIASTLKLTKSQAMLMLSSDKERKILEKKAASKKRDQSVSENWEKGIVKIQKTLLAWGKILDGAMRGFTNLVAAMFGFDKPGKSIMQITRKISNFMLNKKTGLVPALHRMAEAWRKGGDELPSWMKRLKLSISILKFLGKVIMIPVKSMLFFMKTGMDLVIWLGEVTGATKVLSDAIDWVSNLFNEWSKVLDNTDLMAVFKGAIDWLVGAGKSALNSTIGWIKEQFNLIPEFVKNPLEMIGGFFKKWFWTKPKELINKLIEWIPQNVGKIGDAISKYSGLDLVTGLFSGDEGATPKTTATSKPVRTKTTTKKASGKSKGKKDMGEQMEITFKFEGVDEFAEAFAKIITVKQVKRSRRG